MTTRIVDSTEAEHIQAEDPALRPRNLDEYIGQHAVVDNLKVYIQAAKNRGDAMDHVLDLVVVENLAYRFCIDNGWDGEQFTDGFSQGFDVLINSHSPQFENYSSDQTVTI